MKATFSIGMTLPALLVLLLAPASIPAQEEEQDQAPEQAKMEERIYVIKYRDVVDIYRLIAAFNSRSGGRASADRESSVLVVRDTPEILTKIEEIINAADIPPENISLTFFLFTVKKGDEISIPEKLPGRVKGGLAELAEAMAYRNFQVVSSGLLTITSTLERGHLSVTGNDGKVFEIYFKPVYNRQGHYLRLEDLTLQLMPGEQPGRRMLMTDIGLEDGGAAVVGASKLDGGDEALVLVVTMKVQ